MVAHFQVTLKVGFKLFRNNGCRVGSALIDRLNPHADRLCAWVCARHRTTGPHKYDPAAARTDCLTRRPDPMGRMSCGKPFLVHLIHERSSRRKPQADVADACGSRAGRRKADRRSPGTRHRRECRSGPGLLGWGDPKVAEAKEIVKSADLLVVASPTYKATYTTVKLFLDQFGAGELGQIPTFPLMLGGSPAHALAPELTRATGPRRDRRELPLRRACTCSIPTTRLRPTSRSGWRSPAGTSQEGPSRRGPLDQPPCGGGACGAGHEIPSGGK